MSKLNVQYLGLNLKSPIIAGSSSYTSSPDRLKEAEDCGAGAVVLKSLFEEQINSMIASSGQPVSYPEADDYMAFYIKSNAVDNYLKLVSDAKKALGIPVIPSINCISPGAWLDYAARIQDAGADALEVNMFFLPAESRITSAEAEEEYLKLVGKLKTVIKIPFALKIGFRFSNILNLLEKFHFRGVRGVVMFNRFYEPDIDIEKMAITSAGVLSTPDERRYVLRWIAMASALGYDMDISASTGVRSGEDAIKYILAGARTVQVCSVLYERGLPAIKTINSEIEEWMDRKGFKTLDEFTGKLNYSSVDKPTVFERTQFMKYFSSHE